MPVLAFFVASLITLPGSGAQEPAVDAPELGDAIPDRRPDPDGTPTKVFAIVHVVDVVKVDNVEQSFTADFFVALQWKDPRLARSEPGRTVAVTDVWTPRVQVMNKRKLWKDLPEAVDVQPDGTTTYIQRFFGELSCPVDLRDFPFDSQSLQVSLVAVGNTPEEVEFVHDERTGRASTFSLPDWRIIGEDVRNEAYSPPSLPRAFAMFTYDMTAKRRSRYFLFKAIVPLMMIVLMSWAVFWIDPSLVPAQIGVASTSILTLIAYQFSTALILPRVPYLTRMDQFTMLSSILVFLALAEAITTGVMAKRDAEFVRRMDRVARIGFPVAFGGILVYSFLV